MKHFSGLNSQLKRVIVFLIGFGAINLVVYLISNGGFETTFTDLAGNKFISLTGTMTDLTGYGFYKAAEVVGIIILIFYIIAGIMVLSLSKFSYWLALIMSLIMFLEYPIGSILSAFNIYYLTKNKTFFYKKSNK